MRSVILTDKGFVVVEKRLEVVRPAVRYQYVDYRLIEDTRAMQLRDPSINGQVKHIPPQYSVAQRH